MSKASKGYREELTRFYESFDEGSRWPGNRGHQLERRTTLTYLKRVLRPASRVLDCCAGTGAYCFDLAQAGHEVVAGDIAANNVAALKAHPQASQLADVLQLDACDLSPFDESAFDAVLVFGAFYHLPTSLDRTRALAEAARVSAPQGHVAVSYLNRYGCFQAGFIKHPDKLKDLVEQYQTGIKGVFYRASPHELLATCSELGLDPLYHLASDGLAQAYAEQLLALDADEYKRFCAWHLRSCEDPSVLGCSVHGLIIAQKLKGLPRSSRLGAHSLR